MPIVRSEAIDVIQTSKQFAVHEVEMHQRILRLIRLQQIRLEAGAH